MSPQRRSILCMALFAALWATIEAVAAAFLHGQSPYQVVWTRYGVHLACMLLWWGWRDGERLWRTSRPLAQWSRSMLMLGMPASWIAAQHAGVDLRTLLDLFWLSPVLILALGGLVLGERAPARRWIASAAAVAGAWLMVGLGPLRPAPSLLYPLAMALCFSLYVVMTRAMRGESTRTNLFHTGFWIFAVLTPAMPWVWRTPTPLQLGVIVAIGLTGLVALYALDRMAASAAVSLAAPVAVLEPAFGLAIAAVWGGAAPPGPALAGVAVAVLVTACLWCSSGRDAPLAGEGAAPRRR